MKFGFNHVRTLVLACAVALAGSHASARAGKADFLIHGMSLESMSFVPGTRVSYLVISRSFGAADSSYVELRVLEHGAGSFRLEFVSSPYPPSKEESITVRVRLDDRVTSDPPPESFGSCVLAIDIKEGTGAFREPTAREIDDMDIESMFLRSDDSLRRIPLSPAAVEVPAGIFSCEGAEYSRETRKSVSLGGVQALRVEEERSRIWISRDVPLWGLVKSTVEKRRRTIAAGVPDSAARARETATESILLSFTKPRRSSSANVSPSPALDGARFRLQRAGEDAIIKNGIMEGRSDDSISEHRNAQHYSVGHFKCLLGEFPPILR